MLQLIIVMESLIGLAKRPQQLRHVMSVLVKGLMVQMELRPVQIAMVVV